MVSFQYVTFFILYFVVQMFKHKDNIFYLSPATWIQYNCSTETFCVLCSMSNATEISSNQTNFRNVSDFNVSCSLVNRTTAEIFQAIACSFIFLTATLGNTMVVIVVYKERRMRTTVNFLIVNMALSDFLCSMLVIPRILTELYTYPDAWLITGTAGLTFCKAVRFFQDVTVAVSLLSLLMIAVERYYAISCPVVADPIPRKRCALMIAFTWLVAFLTYGTHLFTFKLSIEEEGPICHQSWKQMVADSVKAREIEFVLHTVLSVIVPFIVVTAFYSTILIRIRRSSVPGEASSRARIRQQKRNRNVLHMLLAVVIAFGICWFPFIVCNYVLMFVWVSKNRPQDIPCGLEIFGEWAMYLAYLNSSVNPVIYFVFCENYRKGLMKLTWPCLSPFRSKQHSARSKDTVEMQFQDQNRRSRRRLLRDQR